MDDDISERIWDVEKSIRTRFNCSYRNVAYDIAMSKKHRICIYYNDGFMCQKHPDLRLEDGNGNVMGALIPPEEAESYRSREDVLWISDDFVIFTDVKGESEEAFAVYPFDIPEIRENVEGCGEVYGTSPTMSSDMVLKDWGNIESPSSVYTAIVAFD